QSSDGRAAYVTLYLAGNMGETESNESVASVREIVDNSPAPPGRPNSARRPRSAGRPTCPGCCGRDRGRP
ncbi:hypothetical protein C6A85_13840, partial [Mycobacterium sp. ITM-2017-0098]